EAGYWRAYRGFYRGGSLVGGAVHKPLLSGRLRHIAYAPGLGEVEWVGGLVIRTRRVTGGGPGGRAGVRGVRGRKTANTLSPPATDPLASLEPPDGPRVRISGRFVPSCNT